MKQISNQANIQSLRKISSMFGLATMEVDQLLSMVMDSAREISGVRDASLLMADENDSRQLKFYQASGKQGKKLKDIEIPSGVGIAGIVYSSGEPIISNDVQNDSRWYRKITEKVKTSVNCIACFPLTIEKNVIGVVQFLDK
ncbi:uncharacterized protein METZ01_LOCUS256972, partial [marine metagenome]